MQKLIAYLYTNMIPIFARYHRIKKRSSSLSARYARAAILERWLPKNKFTDREKYFNDISDYLYSKSFYNTCLRTNLTIKDFHLPLDKKGRNKWNRKLSYLCKSIQNFLIDRKRFAASPKEIMVSTITPEEFLMAVKAWEVAAVKEQIADQKAEENSMTISTQFANYANSLNSTDRLLLEASIYLNMSSSEIAGMVGMTDSSVRRRKKILLEKFRGGLKL